MNPKTKINNPKQKQDQIKQQQTNKLLNKKPIQNKKLNIPNNSNL